MASSFKKPTKRDILNLLLVVCGAFVLALGDALFIVPCNLITGGCASIGIIVQNLIGDKLQVVDIVTAGLQIILFLVGFVFLGKKFALQTLVSSLCYPAFLSLLYRLNVGSVISETFNQPGAEPMLLNLLYAIFGGILIGSGVALAFLGKGSTGGMDIIAHIFFKFLHIKESITTFVLDAIVVVVGMVVLKNIPLGLIGIISAFVSAVMVQVIYVYSTSYYVGNIISSEYEKISAFIQDDLGRGCTIVDVKGGYKGEPRKMIRVALKKEEAYMLKTFISDVDPLAFATFSKADAINGEGFVPLPKRRKIRRKPRIDGMSDGK